MAYTAQELSQMATDLVQEAEKQGSQLRLLGGLAFYIQAPNAAMLPSLQRAYKDLDFVVNKKGARALPDIFTAQGWTEDRRFNALHGATRLLFFYQDTLQADVFIGQFVQCHTLDLSNRLEVYTVTLPGADLLLTKLQIRQLNSKDVQDILALLLDQDLSNGPQPEHVDQSYIARLTADDWGWYTTVHDNLEAVEKLVPQYLEGNDARLVESRLAGLRTAIEQSPKGLRWRMRDKVGRRIPWYDEPEEVNR